MAAYVISSPFFTGYQSSSPFPEADWRGSRRAPQSIRCVSTTEEKSARVATVKNGRDSLVICRILNGMWQTSGGWGRIDRDDAVEAMLRHADAGLTTFDMADHYGPAEDLYGIFINRVRRERPPEFLEEIRGLTKWVPAPVKMTTNYVRDNINISRKRMDVASLDMLQFHWWDYSNPGYLDALKHLSDLKEQGKIKTLALTNFDTERLQIILENGISIVSNQVQHSVVDMRPQQKMVELCQLAGVQLITSLYGTVMGGLLSERFLDANITIPFAGPPINTPSLQKYKRMVDAWGNWSAFQALLQTLKKVASKHGVLIPAVAVKYILNQALCGLVCMAHSLPPPHNGWLTHAHQAPAMTAYTSDTWIKVYNSLSCHCHLLNLSTPAGGFPKLKGCHPSQKRLGKIYTLPENSHNLCSLIFFF